MKARTIVSKVRNAVQIQLCVNGELVKTYRNVELPESIKELEITGSGFWTTSSDKVVFQLHFAPDVLPNEFPASRIRRTKAEIAEARQKAQAESEAAKAEAKVAKIQAQAAKAALEAAAAAAKAEAAAATITIVETSEKAPEAEAVEKQPKAKTPRKTKTTKTVA